MDTIHKRVFENITSQWLLMVSETGTENPRITDYARILVELLDLYDAARFSATQNQTIQRWLRSMYTFLFEEGFITKRFSNSNWHIYRLWVMAKIAVVLKNEAFISFLRSAFHEYMKVSLEVFPSNHADYGALIDFVHRDSLSYHVYTLFGIVQTVRLLEPQMRLVQSDNTFRVLWSRDDSLKRAVTPAVRFLMPYLRGQKIHTEFVNSRVAADRSRSEFGKPYNTRNATYVYRILVEDQYV